MRTGVLPTRQLVSLPTLPYCNSHIPSMNLFALLLPLLTTITSWTAGANANLFGFNRVSRRSFFLSNHSRQFVKRQTTDFSRLYKSLPLSPKDSEFIVAEHNRFRRMTPATNIRLIRWNDTLAVSAQSYAETCRFDHSPGQIRPGSGENIWAAPWQDFNGAVQMWYNEVYLRDCGCNNGYKHCCGHYTQVVWADSHQIGCGLAQCNSVEYAPGERFVLICHYYPAGNIVTVDRSSQQYVSYPAFEVRSKEKPECSGCPSGSLCDNGLCA